MGRVVTWDELTALRERWRSEKKTVVWTNGCFDILHVGHARNLAAAMGATPAQADEVVRRLGAAGDGRIDRRRLQQTVRRVMRGEAG